MIAIATKEVHEVAHSVRAVDFILYNTRNEEGGLDWVYWHRGVSAYEAANTLFSVRLLLDSEGEDRTYDFELGEYVDPSTHPEAGWIRPTECLDHSGGVIVRFGGLEESSTSGSERLVAMHPWTAPLTLTQMTRDSDYPPRIEIRTRHSSGSPWRSRIVELRVKPREERTPEYTREEWGVASVQYAGAGV